MSDHDWTDLGVVALPHSSDEEPKGIAVVPKSAVCVGGRDMRAPALVGKAQPGDAVLHSTGLKR